MNKTYYVCKYTPVELLEALGGECEILNDVPEGFDLAEQVAHPNICGFGKAVLEAVLAGKVKNWSWSTAAIRSEAYMTFWKTAARWTFFVYGGYASLRYELQP